MKEVVVKQGLEKVLKKRKRRTQKEVVRGGLEKRSGKNSRYEVLKAMRGDPPKGRDIKSERSFKKR